MWSTIATWPVALQAVEKAAQILSEGGNAVDAAELGIHTVESDPTVDSVGKGGWLNARGELEMDAAMMHGGTLQVGCVAAMQGFEHPVTVARAVMEKSKHNIIVGTGAEEFAKQCGIEKTDDTELVLPKARKQYEENCRKVAQEQQIVGHDTIGLITLDQNGDIVAATSTSGACMKTPGRVGEITIKKETKAPQAAGKIHSDFERGFIRAQVIAFNDLKDCGSLATARSKGLVRTEGKEYVMQDGDVVEFLFNV